MTTIEVCFGLTIPSPDTAKDIVHLTCKYNMATHQYYDGICDSTVSLNMSILLYLVNTRHIGPTHFLRKPTYKYM